MIKIDIQEGLIIEVDLSIKDSVELINALIENKNETEVKLLMAHLATIVDAYKAATIVSNPKLGSSLSALLKDESNPK